MDACLRVLEGSGSSYCGGVGATPPLIEALSPLVALFGVSCIENDLAWFMSMEIITPKVNDVLGGGGGGGVCVLGGC